MAWRAGKKVSQNLARMATPPASTQEALQDLQSGDFFRSALSLDYLKSIPPDPALQPQIARELERMITSGGPQRAQAAEALVNWATPEQVPALIKVIEQNDSPLENSARKALARLKDPRAIPVFIAGLQKRASAREFADALIAYGSGAETEVVKHVEESDMIVRFEVHRVLRSIGTAKILPDLEQRLAKLKTEKSKESRDLAEQLENLISAIKVKTKS
jgi:HEAT repeat protein